MHSKLLKQCAGILAVLLTKIFDKSLHSAEVPSERRKANVTAVHKKRNRQRPLNYRPISLTSIVYKLLQSNVRDHVMEHLIVKNLINPNQHEFVSKRSCMTQQLET